MKTLKLLSMLVFVLCLVGTVSAVNVYSDWADESQSISITDGDSAVFRVDTISINPPMTINIKLYDSESNLVHTFESDLTINDYSYFSQYTIDSSVYSATGNYELIISGSDKVNTDNHILSLTINEVVIPDTTAPVITLLGDNPITLTLGTTYTEYGATALDDIDGDITGSIVITNPVNVYVLGTYTVTYNVQDIAGNPATEVTRIVNVVNGGTPDTTAPVITLLGDNLVSVALGDTYTDAGATALDDVDGDITANIVVTGSVDTSVVGVYTLAYNVQDSSGNNAVEVTRTINVYDPNDTTAPVINVITPEEDEEYDDSELTFEVKVNEVAEVTFSLDGGSQVTMDYMGMSGTILTFEYSVDLSEGDHEVIFYATDAAGNTASVTVEFSVDTSKESDKNDGKTYVNDHQSDYEEELYLDQFEQKKIIYLDEEIQPKEDMNWWQKFIAWLKKIFGFD